MPSIKTFDAGAVASGGGGVRRASAEDFGPAAAGAGQAVGAAISDVGVRLSAAQDRNSLREATVDRATVYSKYQTEVEADFQQRMADGGFAGKGQLAEFNQSMRDKLTDALGQHSAFGDSAAKLEVSLIGARSHYEGLATTAMRDGQIEILTTNFGDQLNPTLEKIRSGQMSIAEGYQAVNDITDDVGGSEETGYTLPKKTIFSLHDAAQSAVAESALNKELDNGNWRAAMELFNDPANDFGNVLDQDTIKAFTKRIGGQRLAFNTAEQESIIKRNNTAVDFGFPSWDKVPQNVKIAIATNQPIPGFGKPREPQSTAGKQVSDRQFLVKTYGPDHPSVKQFDRLVRGVETEKALSPVGKLISDLEVLKKQEKGPGDPGFDAIVSQIEGQNKKIKAREELVLKQPAAKIMFDTVMRKADGMRDDAKTAIMLWTGEDTYKAALKKFADIKDGRGDFFGADFALGTTGFSSSIASQRRGSTVNEIDSALTRIGGSRMLEALDNLRKASPTGSSGMGQLNETEGKSLRFQEGALTVDAPIKPSVRYANRGEPTHHLRTPPRPRPVLQKAQSMVWMGNLFRWLTKPPK